MKRLLLAATVIVVLAAATVVAGCGSDSDDSSDQASVTFTNPADGAMESDEVTADVDLSNFAIDSAAVGGSNSAGTGHLHFSMDNGKYDYPKYSGANGELAEKLGVEGKYSPSVKPTITYKGLPKGQHTLTVALANNDHSDEGTKSSTTFTVE